MNSSRRSLFGLFGAAAVIGASAAVAAPAVPKAPTRRFFNGKPVCGCENPEWDVVYEAAEPFFMHPGCYSGAHSHTISGMGGMAGVALRPRQALYCAFCGGVQEPPHGYGYGASSRASAEAGVRAK